MGRKDETGSVPAGGWAAILAFIAIMVAVVFAIMSGSGGGSHSGSPTTANGSASTSEGAGGSPSFTPVDGCTLLTDDEVQQLTNSSGVSGTVTARTSSFTKGLVWTLAVPGPGWVTNCRWTAYIKVPSSDPESCFWAGDEPGITINLTQHVDQSEAAAVSYLTSLNPSAPLTPEPGLNGSAVGTGAAGTLTVEQSYLRWQPGGEPTLPPKGCRMGGGPVATLNVLFGGPRLGAGITSTLTIYIFSQWDEQWGRSAPITALEAVAQRALSRLPT
jgi:hypothetical protein